MTVETEQGIPEVYEGPHDAAQDALNAAAEKTDATEPQTREHREAERFRRVQKVALQVDEDERVMQIAHAAHKTCKEAYEASVQCLRQTIKEPDQLPLFVKDDYILAWQGAGDPRCKQALMDIPQLKAVLTWKLLENLNEAGVMTLGDLIERQKVPGGINVPHVGPVKADKIYDAVSDYITSLTPEPDKDDAPEEPVEETTPDPEEPLV